MPEHLPPLRLLLVWDNLAGHKSAAMVIWLCQHGVMPLYTSFGGSWLNRAESIQRILKRRALAGQHPQTAAEIGIWFEQTPQAWNQQPPPLFGTASAGGDGVSTAVTPRLSAAQPRMRNSRSQAARAAIMNGIFQAN